MKKLILFTTVIIALVSSCKKEDPPPVDENPVLTDAMARDSLYYLMKQWYYWVDSMPAVTKENYSDPYKLMDAMRFQPRDRWSFVADYNEFVAEMQGTFVGHGFRIGLDNADVARIALIYSKSPLYAQGVRRGWIVEKINDVEIAPLLKSGDGTAYSNLIGPGTAGISNKFLFKKPDNTEVTITSAKSSFTLNSVILYDTLHLTAGKIAGHIVFESFIEPSEAELTTAFAYFKANGVTDLILDLRYNSGGYLYIAQQLASYIAGNTPANSVNFASLTYNRMRTSENTTFKFISTPSPLSLTRLAVISTRLTASASEAVMNGLDPLMDVVSIGDTTNGKPTGMNGWEVGKKYFFWPVTFKIVNRDGKGDYFGGIAPARIVSDDITHDFDDRNELCLKEAIHYLETGSVTSKSIRGISPFYRHARFSEKPSWMDNGFSIVR
ncbi:MAG: S41 family peptidase [Bacteroidales bacterium]